MPSHSPHHVVVFFILNIVRDLLKQVLVVEPEELAFLLELEFVTDAGL